MEQSATYQAIVRRGREEGRKEGREEEARRILLLQGELKFGFPDASTRRAIDAHDLALLDELLVRLLSAGSWQELLPPSAGRHHNRGRRAGQ